MIGPDYDIEVIAAFWKRVDKSRDPRGCWMWTSQKTAKGFGEFIIRSNPTARRIAAHRMSYELTRGWIPEGRKVDQVCLNRLCVNPDHLEVRIPTNELPCSSDGCDRRASGGRGFCEKHYQSYLKENGIGAYGRHEKSCPTCGQSFKTRNPDKTFCTIRCYLKSEKFAAIKENNRLAINSRIRDRIGREPGPVNAACLCCGEVFVTRCISGVNVKKFCGDVCRRRYYTERFDRFVANPETIALPQCYDEFLTKESLPCLVDGCDWEGVKLAMHVNLIHGISAREFKKMAGFNLSTGVVTPELHESMSRRAQNENFRDFRLADPPRADPETIDPYISLEGREHRVKAMALSDAYSRIGSKIKDLYSNEPWRRSETSERLKRTKENHPDSIEKRCARDGCGKVFKTSVMKPRKAYCSPACANVSYMDREASVVCDGCGSNFVGNKRQAYLQKYGKKIFCGDSCKKNHLDERLSEEQR